MKTILTNRFVVEVMKDWIKTRQGGLGPYQPIVYSSICDALSFMPITLNTIFREGAACGSLSGRWVLLSINELNK
jgi:hypothetical protein